MAYIGPKAKKRTMAARNLFCAVNAYTRKAENTENDGISREGIIGRSHLHWNSPAGKRYIRSCVTITVYIYASQLNVFG